MSIMGRPRVVLAIAASAILLLVSAFVPAMNITHAAPGDVTQVKSGLVAADSLTTGNTTSWTFGGEATILPGAKFTHSEDAQGLHIGVQAGAGGHVGRAHPARPHPTPYPSHART